MEPNPAFLREVAAALGAKGLGPEARILTMCRSGSARGRPSAEFLRNNGFPNALYLEHGFQGDRLKEGPHAGRRIQNGWVNSGLPWEPKMDPKKIYRPSPVKSREWLVILRSGELETQAMGLILATTEQVEGTRIRILLCDAAGYLAVEGHEAGSTTVEPVGRSPRAMLANLIAKGATVEVCGVFLPNREDIEASSLIDGVGVAKPPSIARAISQENVVTVTF